MFFKDCVKINRDFIQSAYVLTLLKFLVNSYFKKWYQIYAWVGFIIDNFPLPSPMQEGEQQLESIVPNSIHNVLKWEVTMWLKPIVSLNFCFPTAIRIHIFIQTLLKWKQYNLEQWKRGTSRRASQTEKEEKQWFLPRQRKWRKCKKATTRRGTQENSTRKERQKNRLTQGKKTSRWPWRWP